MNIPLSKPDITESEIEAVVSTLRSGRLSLGPKLNEFESEFAKYIGARHAVAVNSGTSALHLAIRSLGIGKDDAVITTPFSFIASANCMLYESATPLFVDIEPDTFNIDPEKLRSFLSKRCVRSKGHGLPLDRVTNKIVRAILPVHVFGHPCEMNEIMEISKEFSLFVIEDACEAIGAAYRGTKVGIFGDIGVFAFYPNKQITTAEGGMIVTDDEKIAKLCRSLRNQGRDEGDEWLSHRRLAYNYRLSDISCALGLSQLKRIEGILRKRNDVARMYDQFFEEIFRLPQMKDHVKKSWFVYVICLPETFSEMDRDFVIQKLKSIGVGSGNYFPSIHLQPLYREMFGYRKGDFPVCESISQCTIALPFYNDLSQKEAAFVADALFSIVFGDQKESGSFRMQAKARSKPCSLIEDGNSPHIIPDSIRDSELSGLQSQRE